MALFWHGVMSMRAVGPTCTNTQQSAPGNRACFTFSIIDARLQATRHPALACLVSASEWTEPAGQQLGTAAKIPRAEAATTMRTSYSPAWVPQHHRDITLGRLASYLSNDMFSDANIRTAMYHKRDASCVSLEVYSVPTGAPHPKFEEVVGQQFVPAAVGDTFGPSWSTHWFRLRISVPQDWSGLDGPLLLSWDSGSEAMVWTEDGQPQQGITDQRNEYKLSSSVQPGETFLLYVEMACCYIGGNGDGIKPPAQDRTFTLRDVSLAVPNVIVHQVYYDLVALTDLAKSLPADSAAGMDALYTANQVVNTFRPQDPGTWEAAHVVAQSFLAASHSGSLPPVKARHKVVAIGHCHIDTAWLWPFSETRRKTARSWSSQLQLMDKYPEHRFTASSAQQYEWLRQDYPELFKRIQQAAQQGRFIPVGGSWVEMDANIPSGESIVRQFLYGQRFFQRYFGVKSEVFWLPDTFGYAAQLPQIMQGAAMKAFFTQKLSWNNINTFPHNTFRWEALDGTSVLTHFAPSNTYGSQVNVGDVVNSVRNNRDKDRAPAALLLFGNGDGGGGPTTDMLESLRRLAGAASDEGGAAGELPQLTMGAPQEFFRQLEASARDVLTWRGELYFELHRGTYTSHGANKWYNRHCELLLRDVEVLSTLAVIMGKHAGGDKVFSYPREDLDRCWQDVLLFQFHDVLPGSSIGMVYADSLSRYAEMHQQLEGMRSQAVQTIAEAAAAMRTAPQQLASLSMAPASAVTSLSSADILGAMPLSELSLSSAAPAGGSSTVERVAGHGAAALRGPAYGVFNSLSFARRELVEVKLHNVPQGAHVQQLSKDGAALVDVSVPGLSMVQVFPASQKATEASPPSAHPATVEVMTHSQFLETLPSHVSGSGTDSAGLGQTAGTDGSCMLDGSDAIVYVMSNRFVRAAFDNSGRLVQLHDRVSNRELVPPGQLGNRFRLHEDIPIFWDAWDIEVPHLEKTWDAGCPAPVGASDRSDPACQLPGPIPGATVQILERGPLRAMIKVEFALSSSSSLVQTICLSSLSPMLEFECMLDWRENRVALKVEFPWELAAENATYETQFGAVQRPTRQNTSWDWAKFEVCAHRFADLSEPDYGVALLNDSKYGHATHSNIMRLTLLRSPKCPDAATDMGMHVVRYAVLPHTCGWQAGGVVPAALAFNQALVPVPQLPKLVLENRGKALDLSASLLQVAAVQPSPLYDRGVPVLVIDTIKLAEPAITAEDAQSTPSHDSGARDDAETVCLVVRMYEPHGCRGVARLSWDSALLPVAKVVACNLLEEDGEQLPLGAEKGGKLSSVVFHFSPFKVLSFKVFLAV